MAWTGTGTEAVIPDHGSACAPIRVIHEKAFRGKSALTSAVIPAGVEVLGIDAFHSCYALTDITFPDSLRSIGLNAFLDCGKNASEPFFFMLPGGLTEIAGIVNGGNYAFSSCNAVKVVPPDSDTARTLSLANGDARGWFTYPGETDFRYIFYQSQTDGPYDTLHLMAWTGTGTEAVIPDHGSACAPIRVIHNSVFRNNAALTAAVIPEGVREIQYDAFFGCKLLGKISFPSTLTTIGRNAFNNCAADTDASVIFDLPIHIDTIADDSFHGCPAKLCCDRYESDGSPSLTRVTLGDRWYGWAEGILRVGEYRVPYEVRTETENGTVIHTEYAERLRLGGIVADMAGNGTRTVTIPTGVYLLDENCFAGRTDIGHVIMEEYTGLPDSPVPNTVCMIGSGAFRNCAWLTDITFSGSLHHIASEAFSGCGNSRPYGSYTFTFAFPDSGGTLGDFRLVDNDGPTYAFDNCNALVYVRWIATAPLN